MTTTLNPPVTVGQSPESPLVHEPLMPEPGSEAALTLIGAGASEYAKARDFLGERGLLPWYADVAAYRADQLFGAGRATMARKLSGDDLIALIETFGDEILNRTSVADLADDFAARHVWVYQGSAPTYLQPLIALLRAFTPLECWALVDALEQIRYRVIPQNPTASIEELAAAVGLALWTETPGEDSCCAPGVVSAPTAPTA